VKVFFQMFEVVLLALLLLPIDLADQVPKMNPHSESIMDLDEVNSSSSIYPNMLNPFGQDDPDNGTDEEGMNTTICSDFSAGDLTTICRFWLQGVVLFIVGLFGIIGNSVSH